MNLADLRAHVETDLPDPALQRLLDSAEDEVAQVAGPADGNITETLDTVWQRSFFTARRIDTIVSVTERDEAVDASDYKIIGKREVRKVDSHWTGEVVIEYTPVVDTNLRNSVVIELVRLAAEHRGPVSERTGREYQADNSEYEKRRREALTRLRKKELLFA